MTKPDRTWDDFTHAERAAQHRANADLFDAQVISRAHPASIDPVREAARERLAAEAEDALAAEVAPTR